MIVAVDVRYHPDRSATAAGIGFSAWESAEPCASITLPVPSVEEYIPGQFYRRELPCILAILEGFTPPFACIVIDGYVVLGPDRRPGLGMHLWIRLGKTAPIIGVAKSRYHNTPTETDLYRGRSRRPLHVTSVGIPLEEAKSCILRMKGSHRIPDLLRLADHLTR